MNRIEKLTEIKRQRLAESYNYFLDVLNLIEYKKSDEICKELKVTPRMWRYHCENIMNLYRLGYMDRLVIGTTKGYIATNDKSIINKQLKAKERQFKSMAYNYYNLKKTIINDNDYTLETLFEDFKSNLKRGVNK